ncbi:MAG TPA: general secretion pathway protein GspC [Leptospiraceae bacterium]|nr:general secretion pathway protein GspC [Leptospiraceae bacterium]HMW08265.1 general secretion pathway protein GspC [Leptospiraceae bacterium]HMY34031.1 general secretion pathway protein GspC [Leptospiraceae bacterium]HMZ66315.1 general secretion pathway protein GspC [Leptospiraceae bacterium]HNA09432.1 general secretion pathway protein GspC [Leptospiraceae bacterium]
MKLLNFIFKRKFLLLVFSLILLGFSFALSFRMLLIQFLNQASFSFPHKTLERKQTESNSTFDLSKIDEIVEGNLIRGNTQVLIENIPNEKRPTELDLEIGLMIVRGIVSGNSSFARVLVESRNSESKDYKLGEKIGDLKILQIQEHAIILGKSTYSFRVEVGETIQFAFQKLNTNIESSSRDTSQRIAATQHKPVILSKTNIDRILKDPSKIYLGASFGPNLVDGKIDGMKIQTVSPSHLFSALGAKSGDIIKRVNGMPLGETEKMLEIWSAIKVAERIDVDLERKGEIHSYIFLIRN